MSIALRGWYRRGGPMFLLLAGLLGCKNACQELCVEIAAYAQECDLDGWDEGEIESCEEKYASKKVEDAMLETCETQVSGLRDEWECDDLEAYFIDDTETELPPGAGGDEEGVER